MNRVSRTRAGIYGSLVVAALAAPFFLPPYPLFVLSLAIVNIIAVLGVNLTMGYAGQISLGHAGFTALGAYATALLMVQGGWSFWLALPASGVIAGMVGYLLGLPALRLGPLYVSMVTFGFGLAVVLIVQNWYELANGPNGMAVPPPELLGWFLEPERFHFVIVIVAAVLFLITHNILHARLGRAFVALRESEVAARAMGINLAATKTTAFGLGAAYGGLAGSLFAGLTQFVNPDAFIFGVSITYVTMAILGGSGFFAGPIIGGLTLTIIPELLRGAAEYKEFLTGFVLLTLLIFLPRGVVGLLSDISPLRTRTPEVLQVSDMPAPERASLPSGAALLRLENVSLSFGGLAALKDISLTVHENEIVSIIGPNGAGKTTVFNSISGFYTPDRGAISFDGRDLLEAAAHRRASIGISRTFQNLELFPEMSVLDNVLVGTHTQLSNSGLASALRFASERKRESEQVARATALLNFVGLLPHATERAGNLSFGHQRLLEIARAMASKPKLLMLDEPAAGLNSAEMESLTRIIKLACKEYGTTILFIAHTMSLVMGISDRIIVLHHGEKIAEGSPAEIQRNQSVIDAYLGEAPAHA